MFPLLCDIRSCALVKILCYTLVASLFFYTGFFTSFILYIHIIIRLFTTILSTSSICSLSSVFNIFSVLKPPKRYAITSPSYTSKRGRSASQLIFLLGALKMRCPSLVSPSLLSKLWRLSQSPLLLDFPLLIRILDDIYLIYEIYLIQESLTNCHLRMFHLIVVPSTRSDW